MAGTVQEIGVLTAKDDDGTVHELYPVTKTEAVNGLDEALAAKINTADIVDNLESTSTVLPLSANQGNILNDKIENLRSNSISNIYVDNDGMLHVVKNGIDTILDYSVVKTQGMSFFKKAMYHSMSNGGTISNYSHMWFNTLGIDTLMLNDIGGSNPPIYGASSLSDTGGPAISKSGDGSYDVSQYDFVRITLSGGSSNGGYHNSTATYNGFVTNIPKSGCISTIKKMVHDSMSNGGALWNHSYIWFDASGIDKFKIDDIGNSNLPIYGASSLSDTSGTAISKSGDGSYDVSQYDFVLIAMGGGSSNGGYHNSTYTYNGFVIA